MIDKANSLKRFFISEKVVSIATIVLVTLLTYGVLIPWLGYYRDDWYLMWTAQAQGAKGIVELFKIDRPFIGVIYSFDYFLLGQSKLGWHLYALLLRAGGGLAFMWLLRMLWPNRRVETTLTASLFIIYPGFYQQPNAVTFKNILLAQTCAVLSMALTVNAIQTKRAASRAWSTFFSLLLALLYLMIYEAMIGIEAARLLLLWYVFHSRSPEKKFSMRQLIRYGWPYLLLALFFAYWRLFIFKGMRRAVNVDVLIATYEASPLYSLSSLFLDAIKNALATTVFAWAVPPYQFLDTGRRRDFVAALAVATIVTGVVGLYLWAWRKTQLQDSTREPSLSSLHSSLLGITIVALTIIPIVAARRTVIFGLQWDRYTYQSALGVAMFIGGAAFYAIRTPARWFFIMGLITLGVITHYFSAAYYRDFWEIQRNVWWQISWRVPDLSDGTTVILSLPPEAPLREEYEVWGPLNIIYNPGAPLRMSGQIPYPGIALDLEQATLQERQMRSVLVRRDYGKSLVMSLPTSQSCLHILDSTVPVISPYEPLSVSAIAKYSDIDLIRIDSQPHIPPVDMFGKEPEHTWCFYYQKINLALQRKDWEDAARLADTAIANGLHPFDQSEWFPVIVAYVNAGDMRSAHKIATRMASDPRVRATLCAHGKTERWQEGEYEQAIDAVCSGK
ncbi:MAG: hypothetical protein D6770_03520 [Anaerolineae bacterium]|nr:MAG: hypothetical protein D6770_03520 [Anaerolineae bacterium]